MSSSQGLSIAVVAGRNSGDEQWRRLPLSHASTAELLPGSAGLLAGLESRGQPVLRWATSTHPALILGSSQRLSEVNFDACEESGVTVHRRRSGGGAVFADAGLLWLDVALPAGHRWLPPNVTEAYRWFGEVWAGALGALGIESRVIAPGETRPFNAALDPAVQRACYGGVSPYEVLAGHRKLVGFAQVRRRQGGLLQAGVYARWEPERIVALLRGSARERNELLELLRLRACGLHDVAAPAVSFDDVIRAWERVLASRGVQLVEGTTTNQEIMAAETAWEHYAPLNATSTVGPP